MNRKNLATTNRIAILDFLNGDLLTHLDNTDKLKICENRTKLENLNIGINIQLDIVRLSRLSRIVR